MSEPAAKIDTVCLIDDDKIYLFSVKRMIEHFHLCNNILVFNNGLEAIEYFQKLRPDDKNIPELVLVDINMPVMNGWEFIEAFTDIKPKFPEIKNVYMVSSSPDPRDKNKAMSYPVITGFMIKPLNVVQLKDLFDPATLQDL